MSVRLAAQTLSRSVAKGILMFVQFGALSEEALVTAELFDKLFNAFNSLSIKHAFPMRHAVTRVSGHMREVL